MLYQRRRRWPSTGQTLSQLFGPWTRSGSGISIHRRGDDDVIGRVSLAWNAPLTFPENDIHWPNFCSMLGQRRRRLTDIEPTLGQCIVLTGLGLRGGGGYHKVPHTLTVWNNRHRVMGIAWSFTECRPPNELWAAVAEFLKPQLRACVIY